MNYSFHDHAIGDVVAAQDYYFQHAGAQVAARFTSELDRVIQLLLVSPGFCTHIARQRRAYPRLASVAWRETPERFTTEMKPVFDVLELNIREAARTCFCLLK